MQNYKAVYKQHVNCLVSSWVSQSLKIWLSIAWASIIGNNMRTASYIWDKGKKCSTRCGATEHGFSFGAILFAFSNFLETDSEITLRGLDRFMTA